MPSIEQISLGVKKLGENRVEIEEGLGQRAVLDLNSAKLRLENLRKQEDTFADPRAWRARVDATERAVALLEQADGNKKVNGKLKITDVVKRAAAMLIK
jgi:hypothetical protein